MTTETATSSTTAVVTPTTTASATTGTTEAVVTGSMATIAARLAEAPDTSTTATPATTTSGTVTAAVKDRGPHFSYSAVLKRRRRQRQQPRVVTPLYACFLLSWLWMFQWAWNRIRLRLEWIMPWSVFSDCFWLWFLLFLSLPPFPALSAAWLPLSWLGLDLSNHFDHAV